MARYVKRGKVWQYEISYKNDDGKYKKIRKSGFAKKKDAIAEATEIESKLSKGFKHMNGDILLSDYFDQWISLYKMPPAVSPITFKKYLSTSELIKKYFKDDTIKSLTRFTYQERLNEFAKDHAIESTRRFNSYIRKSIESIVDENILITDFTKNAVITGGKEGKNVEDKFLDYEDYKRLIHLSSQDLDPRFASKFMIFVAAVTGMRFAELLGLTWDNIDLENGVINIIRSWDYKDTLTFCSTKNAQSIRKIVISEEVVTIIKDFKRKQQILFEKLDVVPEHDLVFYNAKNGLISNSAVNHKVKSICKELGINKKLTIHGLRHSHASALIYDDINMMAISKRLGHRDITVTQETYAHLIKELENREESKIKDILSKMMDP